MSDALLHALEAEVDKLRGEAIEIMSALADCQVRLAALEVKDRARANPYAILGDQGARASGFPVAWPAGYVAANLKLDGA